MKRWGSLAVPEPFWPSAGVGPVGRTIETAAHAQVRRYAIHGGSGAEDSCGPPYEPEMRDDATGGWAEPAFVEYKPPWRPSEEEIVRAAIAVIFLALLAIMALAAGAILTMG